MHRLILFLVFCGALPTFAAESKQNAVEIETGWLTMNYIAVHVNSPRGPEQIRGLTLSYRRQLSHKVALGFSAGYKQSFINVLPMGNPAELSWYFRQFQVGLDMEFKWVYDKRLTPYSRISGTIAKHQLLDDYGLDRNWLINTDRLENPLLIAGICPIGLRFRIVKDLHLGTEASAFYGRAIDIVRNFETAIYSFA